ncbi:MAG: hypothetical protein ACTSW2_00825 [Alphaproteobacteria bacterium]
MLVLSRFVFLVPVLFGALALAACTTPPPQNPFPDITFKHLSPIQLDVREISVEDDYKAPGVPPNVDHLFPVRPAAAARAWGQDRLTAAGAGRRLRYIVRDASATETVLKTEKTLTGVLTVDQSERYAIRIAVELQIIEDDGRTVGSLTAHVERSVTVPEDSKLGEREKVWFKLVEDSMRELDAQLEKTIKSVFFQYVVL